MHLILLILGTLSAYSVELPGQQQTSRPLINLIDYYSLFIPGQSNNALTALKKVVIERAMAKGVYPLSSQDLSSLWELAKHLSAENFFQLLFNDAMKEERQAIIGQLQLWNREMATVATYLQNALDYDSPLISNFKSIQGVMSGESWMWPDLCWHYFSLEDNAADPRSPLLFRNSGGHHRGIFSEGSVLLLWPSSFYSILFPRNFLGHPMPRSSNALNQFDQIIIDLSRVLEEYGVATRERMDIYALLSKIRQNPHLLFSPPFADEVVLSASGVHTLSLLTEASGISAAKNRLFASFYLQAQMQQRPAIAKMFSSLTRPGLYAQTRRNRCWSLLGKLFPTGKS